MNSFLHYLCAAFALISLTGCDFGKDPGYAKLDWNVIEPQQRAVSQFEIGKELSIDQMQPSDVIVAVNGYPLTKAVFDEVSIIFIRGLKDHGVDNQLVVNRKLEDFQKSYINKFVGQRILVDNAFELKLVTTNQVIDHVQEELRDLAKSRNKTVDQILRAYSPFEKYLIYDIALSFVMSRVIDEKIPTLAEVDDNFVQKVQDEVSRMNKAAAETNELIRARLKSWRGQILGKTIDFASVVKAYSMDFSEDNCKDGECVWGEFEESEMDDPRIAAAVFDLKKGELSDVLEDDDGFHVVKVLDIIPAETDSSGRIVQNERRRLSHIYIEKNPLLIRQDDVAMMSDLKGQMQYQAVNKYIAAQITNGVNRVEYPHGKKFFR